jgi:hypothetical protein
VFDDQKYIHFIAESPINAIFLFLGLFEGLSSYRRSLQPPMRTSSTSKHKISYFFSSSFFWGHFCLPSPDPDPIREKSNPGNKKHPAGYRLSGNDCASTSTAPTVSQTSIQR